MKRTLLFLVVAMVFVASSFATATTENVSNQNSTSSIRYGEDFTASKDEERIIPLTALNKLKGLFRSHPIKATEVKATNFKKSDANEALNKVKSVFGFKKTPTKVTQAKVKDIQTYARDNPNKWEAMT
ncbi:hypothetical protein P3T76_005877 [Phytophthora citrophthora]|uniref:RxLR effector protein n=1 Tax=Phytophthora citrophthora TaxID=4793 RepID=A0AAD9GQH6_9STRA|nr:hypothetical protein P3T76_005877 [Phytophthora citrophthora]